MTFLSAVIERIPPPQPPTDTALQALVFDSMFDTYRGVVTYVRLFAGEIMPGMMIQLMSTGLKYEVKDVGVFTPKPEPRKKLSAGSTGYVIANIKTTADVKIGETMTDARQPATEPLPGFQKVHPMVFSGLYPIDSADYEHLKIALGKLQFNDSALPVSIRKLRGAGVRLPLRLPRIAAHGDRPGTPAPAVGHGHHRHVPERHL